MVIQGTAPEKSFLSRLPKNLIAGLTVAIVALPLALAFGISSGMGAQAGIATAVVAGALAAIFGGSRYQVSGPTGAMTVVLIPLVHQLGGNAIFQVAFLAGVFLILTALLRVGKYVHKLPDSLIEGFTAGIALVIALQQVSFLLGVSVVPAERVWESAALEVGIWLENPAPHAIGLGILAAIVNIFGYTRWPKLPLALLTIFVLTFAVDLIGVDTPRIGALPAELFSVQSGLLDFSNWQILLLPALAVAFLAGLESLLSARIADGMTKHQHNHKPNQELFGQGLANIGSAIFGGMPATAALARTAVNVRAGADSKLSAFSHAAFLAVFVLLVSDLVERIPLAALGGVLVATAWHMIRPSELRKTMSKSKLDAMVLVITLIATVVLDLISALAIGLAIYLVLRKSKLAVSELVIDESETFGD